MAGTDAAVPGGADACPRDPGGLRSRACAPGTTFVLGDVAVVSSRAGGVLETFKVATSAAAEGAALIAAAAMVVLVMIDFVNHDWVGGAFGLASFIAGVAVAALASDPMGLLLAGMVTVFFAILPGAFQSQAKPPSISNTTQILQWAVFGDSSHSDDEKCQKQHPGSNCTMVYGPGVLSSVFQWTNYDSILFLIQYNKGYAMTIPDMAKAFQVRDPEDPVKTANTIAVIDCNNGQQTPTRWGLEGDNPILRNHPTFSIRREMITLLALNQRADEVLGRIVPNPGGDCVLVNDAASDRTLPDYNVTITGSQVAIACNVTAGFNVTGTVVPINSQGIPSNSSSVISSDPTLANNGTFASIISNGSTSTDGQAGHNIDPPPPSPFNEDLLNPGNAVCLSSTDGQICLPNGTYSIRNGALGFDISQTQALSLPQGGELSFTLLAGGSGWDLNQLTRSAKMNFTSNTTTATNSEFAIGIKDLVDPKRGRSINAFAPKDSAPVVCLYTDTNFNGNVARFGPGGGNLSSTLQKTTQSMRMHSGTTAWIYTQYYGDIGGDFITSDVPDLSAELYGPEKMSFSRSIIVIWVLAAL